MPTPPPSPAPRAVLCPFCGGSSRDLARCEACGGAFDALSRQATQNAMGPWFIRDAGRPFRPGCSLETMRDLIARGKINGETIVRGPATNQFWNLAKRTPGLAHYLGHCHNCRAEAHAEEVLCSTCGASFTVPGDRQHLGLLPVALLPGRASASKIAVASLPLAGDAEYPVLGGASGASAPLQSNREPASFERPSAAKSRSIMLVPCIIGLVLAAAAAGYMARSPIGVDKRAKIRTLTEQSVAGSKDEAGLQRGEKHDLLEPDDPMVGLVEAQKPPTIAWKRELFVDSEQSLGTVLDYLRMEAQRGGVSVPALEASISTLERRIQLQELDFLP
ncbi:MAG: hypothetical protein KIT24_04700 [Phycisphaeraceae bacterium]|nr:hypothetical protein [Phycisphaeraceae bacterium]